MAQGLTAHPMAKLFPDMPEADFAALVEDVRKNGVKVPILIYRGQILDGRQRYRACQKLNRPCPTITWNGRDPWLEVQSRNLVRRHLAKDQIYAICKLAAERYPDLAAPIQAVKAAARQRQARKTRAKESADPELRPQGRNKESAELIGAQLAISGTTVKRVDRLAREAPELVARVAAGELSVKKALLQVAQRKHAFPPPAPRDGSIQIDIRRVLQIIKAGWSRCPLDQRAAFLNGLQTVLRELIAEHETTRGPRPADSRNLDRQTAAFKAS